jgi:hypothetical protein
MTLTKQVLLGIAASTMAVVAGGSTGAQGADILRKAPPIQYVKICDQYGFGFFQIPDSSICLRLGGLLKSDNAYQPTHDILFVTTSKTSGAYTNTLQFANQQDHWGYELVFRPRFDVRTETSVGTLRAVVEPNYVLDAGTMTITSPTGPGGGDFGSGLGIWRAYVQWAGWTIGDADSIWSAGNFLQGDIANAIQSDKAFGWTAYYTWTPSGPGLPDRRGSFVPDGWSFSAGVDEPFRHRSTVYFGFGCRYFDLALTAGSAAGLGTVCAADGPMSVPDFVARVHYEGDLPGKDRQHNDQFGIGSLHLVGAWHQITQIAVGPTVGATSLVPPPGSAACGGATCAFGPAVNDHGWAVGGAWAVYVPMWPGTKIGSLPLFEADNIAGNVLYADGALQYVGIGGSTGNLGAGDAYWAGGLARDDTDSRTINTGTGTFYNDKERALATNIQYHHILTDCTDPVHCLSLNLEANYVWVWPGDITKNTDWTDGGLGNARKTALSAEISWGGGVSFRARPVFWRADFEVQYLKVWQDLACNNNGNILAACGAPTALPIGIAQNPASWVWRTTFTHRW